MYCRKCGAENDENSYRCTQCSEMLRSAAIAGEPIGGVLYEAPPHSGPGMASLAIAIFVPIGLVAFFAIVIGGGIEAPGPDAAGDLPPMAVLLMLGFFGLLLLDILAFILGIVGLCQSNRRKVLPLLGMFISAATLGGIVLLSIIGMAMQQQGRVINAPPQRLPPGEHNLREFKRDFDAKGG